MEPRKTFVRYSDAFKRKVVTEIESGKYKVAEAQKIYDIRGGATIQGWIKGFGKHHLLQTVVRIEMKGEQDKLTALEREKRALESALAHAQLKIIALESTIEVMEEKYGSGDKKKIVTTSSSASVKVPNTVKDATR